MLPKDRPILFLKANIRGYTRKDGTVVKPHTDSRANAVEAPRKRYSDERQLDMFLAAGPDASQSGQGAIDAQRAAVNAIHDLRATSSVLGGRLARQYAENQRISLVGQTIQSPEDLAVLAQVYRDPRFETMRMVFVDDAGRVVSQVGLTSRMPAAATAMVGNDVDDYLSELMAAAKGTGATGYYMLHNHPSGNATTSEADRNLTRIFNSKTAFGSIRLKSHVVIDTNEYSVIDGLGNDQLIKKDLGSAEPFSHGEHAGFKIGSPSDVMVLARRLAVDRGAVTLIVVDSQHKVKAVTQIPESSASEGKSAVYRATMRKAGASVFAVGRSLDALKKVQPHVIDAIHVSDDGEVTSLVEKTMRGVGRLFPVDRRTRVSPDTSPVFSYLREQTLAKASIPDGARWITVHPNGADEKGTPVLIQPQPDGSAHVIGGAGGKLNYLKLRGVRKESEYKQEAAERKKAKAEDAKLQRAKDKEAGILESKNKAKQALRDQQHAHESQFVQTVASTMGWDKKDLEFPEQDYAHLSEAAQAKLRHKHHRELMQRAVGAVDLQRQRLVTDHSARLDAGIGEVPLDAKDPDTLSVQDLAPIPANTGGLGFSSDFKGRAEAAGLTADELKAETDKAKADKQATMTDAQRKAAVTRGETAKLVQQELKGIREPAAPDAGATLTDAKQAVELLKAAKRLKQVQQKARAAAAEIDKSASEPKAFVLEYTADPDDEAKIAEDLNNDLRTAQTTAFLSEFKRLAGDKPEETLGKHIGIGAYNSINSLALAVGGDALVDRSVVDVLGVAGAAQVLARRIHKDMPDDAERITEGVQEFHLHHYMETSAEAMGQARELMDAAKEIEIGEAASGADLQVAQELNGRRRKATGDAQKILGQALGEMEANAALVTAMKRGAKDQWQGSLGKVGIESAIQRVRAIGLQRGDYTLESVAGDTFLTINEAGLDRLAKPINRDDIQQVQRNLSIIRGDEDEDGWLPKGVANRPDLGLDVKPGVAPRLAEPFAPGQDLEQSLRDYIGGRAADGDAPGDIVADIQSAAFFQKAGDHDAYRKALDAVAPLKGEDGKQTRAEALGDQFDQYADAFVESRHGGKISPLNRQSFEVNQASVDALHRALAEHPDGVAAFKQVGELTNQDQRTLREHFYRNVAKESPEQGALRSEVERLDGSEPERETTDMFGETTTNPEWQEWKTQRDQASAKLNASGLDWPKYVETMRGNENAYESIQDMIKSKVGKSFADAHNKLNPGKPIKLGRAVIRNNLNHLDATDPAAREERMARERELVDGLRERSQGRYAAGGVADKLDAARDEREAFNQSQMGFFSADDAPPDAPAELKGDERHTLGHVAERQIAGMMGPVGKNFKPGQPTKLWAPTMSGGDNYARQRAIKLVDANKRLGLHLGAGSGKSLVSMAAFTHLHQQGKAKRALFAVPSIVQGQFGGEALRYLEPGKFNWHCEPGASREQRIAAYKNPDHHFVVTTHQALRDDLLHLGAKHAGSSEAEMRDKLSAMTRGERKAWMTGVMQREGINFDFSAVDEGHNLLDRQGKEDSGMSMAIGAMTDNTPYHVSMTADPVRNDDASEVFSALQKIDPDRYADRGAFMRRYGADTLASKDGLKREMSRYFYAHSIQPNVRADKKEVKVPLSGGQKSAMQNLEKDVAAMRIARMEGRVDIEAAKRLSPDAFDGAPEDKHTDIAKGLQSAIGVVKETAVQRIINDHPESEKANEVVRQIKARPGKPGIVFSRSLKSVEAIRAKLEAEGMRVITITGADSSEEKDRKRKMFSPDSGDAQADVLVASDAASTGLNAQRGQWVMQYDTPMTAMTHAQRQARVHRIGQKNDVELIDLVGDHPSERKARDRLASKYAMRDLMSSPLERLDDTGVAHFLKQRQVVSQDSQDGLF